MEQVSFIKKIQSKYVIQKIFSFIEDKNFLLKLIAYSKLSQEELNIKLKDYQISSLNNRIRWKDYLIYEEYGDNFNKNNLKENLEKYISQHNIKYDENIMIESLIYYLKNNPNKFNKKKKIQEDIKIMDTLIFFLLSLILYLYQKILMIFLQL